MTIQASRLVAAALFPLLLLTACSNDAAPTSLTTAEAPTTFSTNIGPHGAWSISFFTTQSGVISVTLTSVGPSMLPLGVAVGIPGGSTACTLSHAVIVLPGQTPQVTVNADPGSYCASVFDPGTLTTTTSFSVTVTHPD